MTKCKGCGTEIIWIKTLGGKPMPCDPAPVMYWKGPGGRKRIVKPNGEVISAETSGEPEKAAGIGYISHWSTCPQAGTFRKGKA